MRRYWSIGWLLCALVVMAAPIVSRAQLLAITVAPPELPVYEQPPIPDPGYIWTPGYWAYGPDGYYWVPGTWVEPPSVGLLWTPGYWGWQDGNYGWNDGYWGQQIGFYGGVDYGYGYGGVGYEGGYWDNGVFAYNRTVNNFGGVTITNVYSKTIITNNNATRASFNGGAGGTSARPTAQEQAAAHEKHVAADGAANPAPACGEHQQGPSRLGEPRQPDDRSDFQARRIRRQGCCARESRQRYCTGNASQAERRPGRRGTGRRGSGRCRGAGEKAADWHRPSRDNVPGLHPNRRRACAAEATRDRRATQSRDHAQTRGCETAPGAPNCGGGETGATSRRRPASRGAASCRRPAPAAATARPNLQRRNPRRPRSRLRTDKHCGGFN